MAPRIGIHFEGPYQVRRNDSLHEHAYLQTAKRIARFAVAIFSDVLLLLPALVITLYALCVKSNFDPASKPMSGKTPILMIHGNGFNEMQWIYGRIFLQRNDCGPVFTLNLDGLLTNQVGKGIRDYTEIVQKKMLSIRDLTKNNKVILIGHSMGGLIAAECERREKDHVEKVITISTPWSAPPLLQFATWALPSLFRKPVRYQDMRDENHYITNLKEEICKSKFRAIYSDVDEMVPGELGSLELPKEHESKCFWLGHYSPMIVPSVWDQVTDWIKEVEVKV